MIPEDAERFVRTWMERSRRSQRSPLPRGKACTGCRRWKEAREFSMGRATCRKCIETYGELLSGSVEAMRRWSAETDSQTKDRGDANAGL